ncbi:hypothetical protein [Acinetobacter zhairhuonensis]|uniref:hypothetical protein n=1 Tax=Acinetobacter sp. A7.4 TaxID=2919921 RepID=UPI001F4E0B0F|nr:hypothetical protein [Acinetobacter sp. A7.4]MCJ8160516.1 hypothetical protein [Acinetobacter sp. A7.4]
MSFLASLLVGKPLTIFWIAVAFFIAYLIVRNFSHKRRAKYLGITTILWLLYAAWEFLIKIKTPDADIRVDLLVIWPILFILSLFSIILLFFKCEK